MPIKVTTIADSSNPNANWINPILGNRSWIGDSVGEGISVLYDFPENIFNQADYIDVPNYVKNAVEETLQTWSNVANINFTRQDGISFSEGVIFEMDSSTSFLGAAGNTYSPEEFIIKGGFIKISSTLLPNASDFTKGQQGYATLIHEIGHILGFDHPNGSEEFTDPLPAQFQNTDYSIMHSYIVASGPITSQYGSPSTPQFADILAIQYLYGANYSYKSGNDIYNFANPDVMTIWDGGGVDLIDGSGYATEVRINLNEADGNAYSTMGESAFWIAYGANIENANGGKVGDVIIGNWIDNRIFGFNGNDALSGGDGNDFINGNRDNDNVRGNGGNDTVRGGKQDDIIFGDSGNDLVAGDRESDTLIGGSGDDILRGGKQDDILEGDSGSDLIYGDKGNDTLRGGSESDIFIFRAESGVDIIQDFEQGSDKLQFSSDIFSNRNDVISSFNNAVIDLGNGNQVTLIGITNLNDTDIIIG